MITQKKICYSVDEVAVVAGRFKEVVTKGSIITLSGLLGAGKTTFVQQLCASFGIIEPVVSPTYSYVSVYDLDHYVIYHFDLYRISGIEEFESLGFGEYLNDPRGIVLIEWPDRIASLLSRSSYRGRVLALSFNYVRENAELREVFYEIDQLPDCSSTY